MKNLLITLLSLSFLLASVFETKASNLVGGHIELHHIAADQYKISIQGLVNHWTSGPTFGSFVFLQVYSRSTQQLVASDTIFYLTDSVLTSSIHCNGPGEITNKFFFEDTITLDTQVFNDPAGYLFTLITCCRADNPNIQNAHSTGSGIVTLFNPLFNSHSPRPTKNRDLSVIAFNDKDFSFNLDFIDEDGDSLAYQLYTPFNHSNQISQGSSTSLSAPYPDPETQFPGITWNSSYNKDNQIPGTGSSPSPKRLKINAITGEFTVTPNVNILNKLYAIGIRVNEFRDIDNDGSKELIGVVFHEFSIPVSDYSFYANYSNTPPSIQSPQAQNMGVWYGDTIVLNGAPVCIDLLVTDPDFESTIDLDFSSSFYSVNDFAFTSQSGTITDQDTFNTSLCLLPVNYAPQSTKATLYASDLGCYDLKVDSLDFWIKFINYSNAGIGGTFDYSVYDNSDINLNSLLTGNPNSNGTWVDVSNSGFMLNDGTFRLSMVNTLTTFQCLYIDQQPNYPPDTAVVELRMTNALSIENQTLSGVILYPNPANDKVTLRIIDTGAQLNETVILTDLQGRILKQIKMLKSEMDIATEEFESGLYIISIPGLGYKSTLSILKK